MTIHKAAATIDIPGHGDFAAQIVRDVRTGLDLAGHHAVAIEEEWITIRNSLGGAAEFVITVPIGKGHKLPLTAPFARAGDDAHCADAFTADLVLALPKVDRARRTLLRYRGLIGQAAWRFAQDARASGDGPILLDTTSFDDIPARHVALPPWQDLKKNVCAVLNLRALGPDLEIGFRRMIVKSAEGVASVLTPIAQEQKERWREWQRLRAPGPRFTVDEITIALLSSFGFDPVTVLRRFQEVPHFTLMVEWQGEQKHFLLSGEGKRVRSNINLGERVCWARTCIVIDRSKYSKRLAPKVQVGQPAGAAVPHPVFHDRVVTKAEPFDFAGVSRVYFDVWQYAFDAERGMLTLLDGQPED